MTRRAGRKPGRVTAAPVAPPAAVAGGNSALLWVAVIFAATVAAYFPALGAGFVWNDRDYVTRAGLRSLHGLSLIWFKLGSTEQYYPLLHSAFWVEHRLWGDSPLGYHLVNVLIHATSASLLGLMLRRLAVPGAWLAAFLFAVHPVMTESVAWISEEKNTLSTLFYLLAAGAYLRFDERRRGFDYGLGLVLFALALLSKTVAATLPAALLVVFWWRRGRLEGRRDVAPLLPWFALGALGGLFSSYVERTYIGARGSDFALSGVARGLVAGRAIWFYLGKLLWPARLIFIYPRWSVNTAAIGQYGYPLAAGVITAALWRWRGRRPGLLAGWLFFIGSLFPTLGFFNVYAFIFSYVADHWQYLASIGIFALLGAGAAGLWAVAPAPARTAVGAGFAAIAVLLGALTWRECGNYRDMTTFYRAILARNPAAWLAHNNLGFELQGAGHGAEAIPHYEAALRLHPDYTECHSNLGAAYFEAGRFAEAVVQDEAALRLLPNYAEAHNNLGAALDHLGSPSEAIAQYQEALRLKPGYVDPIFNLASSYLGVHRFAEAIEAYQEILRLQPDSRVARNDLGQAYLASGKISEAIGVYEESVRLVPDDPAAWYNLGSSLQRANRPPEAIAAFRRAIALQPNYAEAHNNLGATLFSSGQTDAAGAEFALALKVDGNLADAHGNLGVVLRAEGQLPEALAEFGAALRLRPDFVAAELNTGEILQALGRPAEAKAHLDRAAQLQARTAAPP
jgi:tetratricopeptide (TPR) repeat protein